MSIGISDLLPPLPDSPPWQCMSSPDRILGVSHWNSPACCRIAMFRNASCSKRRRASISFFGWNSKPPVTSHIAQNGRFGLMVETKTASTTIWFLIYCWIKIVGFVRASTTIWFRVVSIWNNEDPRRSGGSIEAREEKQSADEFWRDWEVGFFHPPKNVFQCT